MTTSAPHQGHWGAPPWPHAYVIYCHGCQHAWYDDGIGFGDGECGCTCLLGNPRCEDWVIDPPASEVSPEALWAALAATRPAVVKGRRAVSGWTAPESGWYELPSMRKLTGDEVREIEARNWVAPITSEPGSFAAEFDHGSVWSAADRNVTLPNGQAVPRMTWTELTWDSVPASTEVAP